MRADTLLKEMSEQTGIPNAVFILSAATVCVMWLVGSVVGGNDDSSPESSPG